MKRITSLLRKVRTLGVDHWTYLFVVFLVVVASTQLLTGRRLEATYTLGLVILNMLLMIDRKLNRLESGQIPEIHIISGAPFKEKDKEVN